MAARVVVLAGPSGSGKSRLAHRLAEEHGLPVLRLDDFYKSAGDPTLPVIDHGPHPSRSLVPRHLRAGAGMVDWDHPDSWLPDEAVAAMVELCRSGGVDVPVYDIAQDGRCGSQHLDLAGADLVVAEGLFAPDVVEPLRAAGVLAAAFCVRRPALVTFALRLQRDLREHRKPPLVLVRRGIALTRDQRRVVTEAVAKGCEAVGLREAEARVGRLLGVRAP